MKWARADNIPNPASPTTAIENIITLISIQGHDQNMGPSDGTSSKGRTVLGWSKVLRLRSLPELYQFVTYIVKDGHVIVELFLSNLDVQHPEHQYRWDVQETYSQQESTIDLAMDRNEMLLFHHAIDLNF